MHVLLRLVEVLGIINQRFIITTTTTPTTATTITSPEGKTIITPEGFFEFVAEFIDSIFPVLGPGMYV